MSEIIKDTLKATSTPLIKVKEYIKFRHQAITHHIYRYVNGVLDDADDLDENDEETPLLQ